jgi:AcrR family transcriptional regulator
MEPTTEEAARPGRPRRYEAADELERIFLAAFEVMKRNGYQAVTVADILAEAGMSTRSFYRHFAGKDELLHAMFRREAEQFAAAITRRVEAAPDPATALVVWIDEILGFGLDRPRAQRAAVLGSSAVMRSLDPDELRRTRGLLLAPLEGVLEAGVADGSFTDADLTGDAFLVSAVAWDTSGRMTEARNRAHKEELRHAAISFAHRALGIVRA